MDEEKNSQPAQPSEDVAKGIVTPAGVGIKIDDVNQSLWQYIKKRKLLEALAFVPLTIVWEVLAAILAVKVLSVSNGNSNSGTGRGLGYMFVAPFVLFSAWIARIRKQFEDAFLEEFARANNYSFDKNDTVDETYGTIFRLNGDLRISDVVTGTYKNSDLRLFLYQLTVDAGRSQYTYTDTVIELDLHGQLPHLLMMNRASKYRQLGIAGASGLKNSPLQLEGDFNKYFTLYAPKGNEMEALEIFSPDTMALMEDASKHFNVEFAGNRVYIYINGFVTTTGALTSAFALAKKLIEKIAPLADGFKTDSAIIATPVNLQRSRKQPWYANKVGLTFVIFVAVFGIAIVIFALLFATPESSNSPPSGVTGQSSAGTIDANAFPYCGTVPNKNQPAYTQQYIQEIINQNQQLNAISTAIKANNYLASNAIIEQQIAADQQYITALQKISFPAHFRPYVSNLIAAVQNYDVLIRQEETTNVPESTLNDARNTQEAAAKQLHTVLGLPPSTCGFYGP